MRKAALIVFALTAAMEMMAVVQGNDTLNIYTFILAYGGAGALLLAYARQLVSGPYGTGLTLMGVGYLIRALGEWGWGSGILNSGEGYSFAANLPFYLTSLLYASGAHLIYQTVARKLGLSHFEIITALAGALGLVGVLSLPALGQDNLPTDFWIETLDNVVSAFAALLMVAVATLTRGSTLRHWAMPLGLAFSLFLVGNTLYTIGSDTYDYGSVPDVFWIGETLVLMLMVGLAKPQNRTSQN